MKNTIRVIPTPQVTGYWHHDWSDYPDEIKVKMANGENIVYVRKIDQPHPQVVKSIELIKIMKKNAYGGYKAKHEKEGRSDNESTL